MADDKNLDSLRTAIDDIDEKLIDLISQRAQLAEQIAHVKGAQSANHGFYRPEREAQVLRKIMELNPGPLSGEEITRLFREIMSACLALEQRLKIGYLGPEGTFTQAAALKHFGHSINTEALTSIDQVFREVESGACHYGVVPIENSIEGVVNHTLDMLINSSLLICGEVELRIHHHLLSHASELEDIDMIYSHQQSLAQCRGWLDSHLLKVERVPMNSNAEAAISASRNKRSAAIAGETAAEIYDIPVLVNNIEDSPDNTTRFLVIGQHDTRPSGKDKSSILFSTPNKPGALHDMLSCFADNNVSMTRIESRPSRVGMWDYVFFADVEGHAEDQNVAQAIQCLRQKAAMMKLLGSYPQAVL